MRALPSQKNPAALEYHTPDWVLECLRTKSVPAADVFQWVPVDFPVPSKYDAKSPFATHGDGSTQDAASSQSLDALHGATAARPAKRRLRRIAAPVDSEDEGVGLMPDTDTEPETEKREVTDGLRDRGDGLVDYASVSMDDESLLSGMSYSSSLLSELHRSATGESRRSCPRGHVAAVFNCHACVLCAACRGPGACEKQKPEDHGHLEGAG